MDRFTRPFAVCGFGLILAVTGCKSTQPEVPPGRPFAKDGQQRQAIQFSSEGHPAMVQGSAPTMPSNLGGSNLAAGISTPGARSDGMAFGGPEGAYGPPGSAGRPAAPTNLNDPSAVRASTNPPSSIPLTGTPPPGTPDINLPPLGMPSENPSAAPSTSTLPDLNVTPSRESAAPANPIIQPPSDTPGQMGTPNALPSPM